MLILMAKQYPCVRTYWSTESPCATHVCYKCRPFWYFATRSLSLQTIASVHWHTTLWHVYVTCTFARRLAVRALIWMLRVITSMVKTMTSRRRPTTAASAAVRRRCAVTRARRDDAWRPSGKARRRASPCWSRRPGRLPAPGRRRRRRLRASSRTATSCGSAATRRSSSSSTCCWRWSPSSSPTRWSSASSPPATTPSAPFTTAEWPSTTRPVSRQHPRPLRPLQSSDRVRRARWVDNNPVRSVHYHRVAEYDAPGESTTTPSAPSTTTEWPSTTRPVSRQQPRPLRPLPPSDRVRRARWVDNNPVRSVHYSRVTEYDAPGESTTISSAPSTTTEWPSTTRPVSRQQPRPLRTLPPSGRVRRARWVDSNPVRSVHYNRVTEYDALGESTTTPSAPSTTTEWPSTTRPVSRQQPRPLRPLPPSDRVRRARWVDNNPARSIHYHRMTEYDASGESTTTPSAPSTTTEWPSTTRPVSRQQPRPLRPLPPSGRVRRVRWVDNNPVRSVHYHRVTEYDASGESTTTPSAPSTTTEWPSTTRPVSRQQPRPLRPLQSSDRVWRARRVRRH